METLTKICNRCKRELPGTNYYFYRRNKPQRGHADGFSYTCKECEGHPFGELLRFGNIRDGEKQCNECKRWLPADTDHYHRQPGGKLNLHAVCKECSGRKFGRPYERKIINGLVECTKCRQWLPANRKYFCIDNSDSIGIHNWCKKCNGAKEYKVYIPKKKSNKDGYKICTVCGEELEINSDNFHVSHEIKCGFVGACKRCRNKKRSANKVRIARKARAKRLENIKEHREHQRLYREKNRDRINFLQRERNKRKTDKEKFATRIRSSIRHALKHNIKQSKTEVYLGCTIEQFKKYIVGLFDENMTWEAFMATEIEIDHIRPLRSFDLSLYEEQLKAFHYTNCQPLWKFDNRSKGSKYNGVLIRSKRKS